MPVIDLETKTHEVNRRLETKGIYLRWGGDFSVAGNVFSRGAAHLLRGMPVIFPICLNNSYYNEGQIENLARGISEFDNKVYAFLTDGPSKHNYVALGYSENEAVRKARLEGNGLLNRFKRGLHAIGIDTAKKFFHFSWEDIYQHPEWIKENGRLHRLYSTNLDFQNDIEMTTRQVLSQRKKVLLELEFDLSPEELKVNDVRKAVDYTLDEISFITVCHKLLQVEGICFVYKEGSSVLEKLADGFYTGVPIPGIGFLGFHVLPELHHSEIILTTEQLAKLSTKWVAQKPNRYDAPKAHLERAILS